MPNRRAHDLLGAGAGFGTGAYRVVRRRRRYASRPGNSVHDALQVAGSTVAGMYASRVPDIVEPSSLGPNHRSTAHSATVGTAVASALRFADGIEDRLRDAAEEAAARRRHAWQACRNAPNFIEMIWHLLQSGFYLLTEMFAALLSGAVAGAIASYVSHLAADAFTAKSVPVI